MIHPDPKDPRVLRKFFEENRYLRTLELAYIAHRSTYTINKWRKKCGIKAKPCPFKKRRVSSPAVVPKIGTDVESLKAMYEKGYGYATIARMANIGHEWVMRKLKKNGVKSRPIGETTKSKNPCCNAKWLDDHYVIEGLSQKKCAEIAGVNSATICLWLVKFGFDIRDRNEARVNNYR